MEFLENISCADCAEVVGDEELNYARCSDDPCQCSCHALGDEEGETPEDWAPLDDSIEG